MTVVCIENRPDGVCAEGMIEGAVKRRQSVTSASQFVDQDYLDAFNAKYKDVLVGLNTPPDVPTEELDAVARERVYTITRHDVPRPPFDRILDHIDHAVGGAGIDHVHELGYYDRKRIHNLKYYTWVEQQGKTYEEIQAQWYDEGYWTSVQALIDPIDELIDAFNARVAS